MWLAISLEHSSCSRHVVLLSLLPTQGSITQIWFCQGMATTTGQDVRVEMAEQAVLLTMLARHLPQPSYPDVLFLRSLFTKISPLALQRHHFMTVFCRRDDETPSRLSHHHTCDKNIRGLKKWPCFTTPPLHSCDVSCCRDGDNMTLSPHLALTTLVTKTAED